MPESYQHRGIRFLYPENWELEEGDTIDGMPTVTVYAPGGAFWSVTLESGKLSLQELTVAALESLRSEYAESEAEPAEEVIAGRRLSGFDVSFYYVDLINTATIRGFTTPAGHYLILAQAEDRDYRQLEVVFLALTTSLVQSVTSADAPDASDD